METLNSRDFSDNQLKTIVDILNYQALVNSNKTAYIYLEDGENETAKITYQELNNKAKAIASQLQDYTGERALLLYPSGLEFIYAFFGCLYAGVIAVPVYPPRRNQKLSRLLSIIDDAQAKLALTTTSISSEIEERWKQERELRNINWFTTDTIQTNSQ
jgi:acyl-CoA synthetase (AMP-forming)/AMP-acid ligase II